jgi:formate dehydrogenase accessory protein FdhE
MARSSWLHRDTTLTQAYERRAARATLLEDTGNDPAVLRFAAGLYRQQGAVVAALEDRWPLAAGAAERAGEGARSGDGTDAPSGELELDLQVLLPALEALVRYAAKEGPSGLRDAAARHRHELAPMLLAWWHQSRSGRVDYLARVLLRPYAELLASRGVVLEPMGRPSAAAAARLRSHACLSCGGPAWIGWRQPGSGDEAAPRYLGCALCGRRERVARPGCTACGETAADRLPFFQSPHLPVVRLEACDSCQRYVKSIDLTVDARAIPEVDDLASLALDGWARAQGYERLEPSLAGG